MFRYMVMGIAFFMIFSCSKRKIIDPQVVPDSVFISAKNPNPNKIIGKWKYTNNQYFEFLSEKDKKTWEYYFDYGNGKVVQFAGSWEIYPGNKNIQYLKLVYEKIGLSHGNIVDSKTNVPLHKLHPFKRFQIVEFYVDDDYFAMNTYRKSSGGPGLIGEWEHANYDWFDDFYAWSEIPYWMEEKEFENQIISKINTKEDREFVQKECFFMKTPGTYYKSGNLTTEQESRLYDLMTYVKIRNGFKGDFYYMPLSAIPAMHPYYINRLGILEFEKDGNLSYFQKSPFFRNDGLDYTNNLPEYRDPYGQKKVNASGNYKIWENPIYNNDNQIVEHETKMAFYNSSHPEIFSELEFKLMIIKEYNVLMTFPFKRVP